MKKITLSIIAALATGFYHGQTTLSVTAPLYDLSTQIGVPSGKSSQAGVRGCFWLTAYELSALATGSVISSFGFSLTGTAAVPVTGNLTLYLQNTQDPNYMKGNSFSGALAGMTNVYSGNMTIPVVAASGTTTIMLPLSQGFNYTGGNLYVAYDWSSTGPFDITGAVYGANNYYPGSGCVTNTTTLPAQDNLYSTSTRPCFIFTAANMATNDIAVLNVVTPAQIPWYLNNGAQIITADIQNQSNVVNNNIAVTMSVIGNPSGTTYNYSFNDVQTIPSLAPGAITTVTFAPFTTPISIFSFQTEYQVASAELTVSVAPDQNNQNNIYQGYESFTCDRATLAPDYPKEEYAGEGIGFASGTSGIYSFRLKPSSATTVTAIEVDIAGYSQNIGKKPYGVLMNSSGQIIATTNTVTLAASNFSTYVPFTFASPQPLSANTDYYFGLAIPQGNTYPIGIIPFYYPASYDMGFYVSPITGGTLTPYVYGFLAIDAILSFSNTSFSVASTKSIACLGESVTLKATGGATTFTWSNSAATSNSVTFSPTVTATYTVEGADATGCPINPASFTQSVSACTGLQVNNLEGAVIKLMPNPAVNGKSVLSGLSGATTIRVYDISGQTVLVQKSNEEQMTIDLSAYPGGTYLLKVTDESAHYKTVKIVNQD